jgi:hypothetical protein
MKGKRIAHLMCILMLVSLSLHMSSVLAGDEKHPEIEDRTRDVRLTGYFPLFPQFFVKHVDIVSAWFHEDSENPDYLYASLKLRGLNGNTETLEAIYLISWTYKENTYNAGLKIHPDGIANGGYNIDINNGERYERCEGTLDEENNCIIWEVSKDIIGDPKPGDVLTNTFAYTDLRCTEESGLPRIDLFKDLTWNAKTTKDYTIQY